MNNPFNIEEKINALSWKQPFADLMLHNKIETRSWSTKYRGLVLICASKQRYNFDELFRISGEWQIKRISYILGKTSKSWYLDNRLGKAISIGRLVDCRPMQKEDEDKCFVNYQSDLFCHIYKDVQPIEPLDWTGSQRWKEVPIEFKEKITIL